MGMAAAARTGETVCDTPLPLTPRAEISPRLRERRGEFDEGLPEYPDAERRPQAPIAASHVQSSWGLWLLEVKPAARQSHTSTPTTTMPKPNQDYD